MDGEAGWWTTSGNIGLPPLARAMGVGRQQTTFIALKLNISFILHVLRFEGIISAIKVVYDLEVLVQIDTACVMVSKLDLSSCFQQWGPHLHSPSIYTIYNNHNKTN